MGNSHAKTLTDTPEMLGEQQRVQNELIRIHMGHAPIAMIPNLATALLVLYISWGSGKDWLAGGWYLLDIIISLVIVLVATLYKRNSSRFSGEVWSYLSMACWMLLGLLWGGAAIWLIDLSDAYQFITITAIFLGLLSGTFYSLSILPPLHYLFSASLLSLYALAVYLDQVFFLLAIGAAILGLFLAWVSHQIYKIMQELFIVRFQNEALTQSIREEKEEVEKSSRAKTRFLASASHDLRQPLQAQRLYVEAMIDQMDEGKVTALGRKVIYSQQAMQKMLDTLLDLSKLDAGMMAPHFTDISLKQLFTRMEQEFATQCERKGLYFHLHWPPEGAAVHSDPGMVESMVRNLISNAIRYTDRGTVMLAARRRGSAWQIEVRDSGKGIAEDKQQTVFEEFRQLDNPERDREKGLGLGLSIVRRLAQLLDHQLTLKSQTGRGSVFAIGLPVALFPADETQGRRDEEPSDLSGFDILVIDDEAAIRDGIATVLELSGCRVMQAADRLEAERIVKQKLPDGMVVDYRLAKGDDGIEVIAHLNRTAGTNIPALLLTGDTAPDVLKKIKQSGIPLLHKPVASRTLIHQLSGILETTKVAE